MLKSFFFNLYLLIFNFSFYLFLLISLVSFFLLFSTLRRKFIFFLLSIILYSIWGFLLDLDGIILVFLTAEFTIFLLFLMTYIQLYSNYTFTEEAHSLWNLLPLFLLVPAVYQPLYTNYALTSFYKAINHIVSSDFYILYYFLFEKLPVLVVFLTLLISFFSLFFILMYYSLKLVKLAAQKNLKNVYYLRKQTLVKQTAFNTRAYTFQN